MDEPEFRYEDYTRPIGHPLDRLSEEWWDKHIGLEFVAAQDISSLTSFDAVVATLPFIELLHPRSIFSPGASATLVAGFHQDDMDMLAAGGITMEEATDGALRGCRADGNVDGLYEIAPLQQPLTEEPYITEAGLAELDRWFGAQSIDSPVSQLDGVVGLHKTMPAHLPADNSAAHWASDSEGGLWDTAPSPWFNAPRYRGRHRPKARIEEDLMGSWEYSHNGSQNAGCEDPPGSTLSVESCDGESVLVIVRQELIAQDKDPCPHLASIHLPQSAIPALCWALMAYSGAGPETVVALFRENLNEA